MKENKIWNGLKHYAGVSLIASAIFTVLLWAVALTNVFTGTLAHGVFAILATILIIIAVGMVGLVKALNILDNLLVPFIEALSPCPKSFLSFNLQVS